MADLDECRRLFEAEHRNFDLRRDGDVYWFCEVQGRWAAWRLAWKAFSGSDTLRQMLTDKVSHASDCAVHNPPAYPAGACDCGTVTADQWQPIETAPKGGGTGSVTDSTWTEPQRLLLLFRNGEVSIGYWDWYYAEGGRGYEGGTAWIEPCSGTRLDLHYDAPIGWRNLPPAPISESAAAERKEG